ncbi:hypothetical protein FHS47_000186 [Lutibacter sp. SG786]|jgi:hypothetical protein|nr:hypothetical protein [Luteibacter sp. SG786]
MAARGTYLAASRALSAFRRYNGSHTMRAGLSPARAKV